MCDSNIWEVDSELYVAPDADEEDYVPSDYYPCDDNAELCETGGNEKRRLHARALPGFHPGVKYTAKLAADLLIKIPFAPYPSGYGALFTNKNGGLATLPWQGGIMMANTVCTGAAITYVAAADMSRTVSSYTGKAKNMIWNVEHLWEVSIRCDRSRLLLP